MPKKDSAEGFGTAEVVANFLLEEAIKYAHQAASYEVANILFSQYIEDIEPDPTWESSDIPVSVVEWLERQDELMEKILDPNTIEKLADAWSLALEESWHSNKKLTKNHILSSITDVVGLAINLTVCLETILNRHLFYLRESGSLTGEHFKSVDRAELMPKLLFCFKEQILSKNIHVSAIKKLVSLRNKSVHYRVDESDSINLSIKDLLDIWKEFESILSLTVGEPTKNDLREYREDFEGKWLG